MFLLEQQTEPAEWKALRDPARPRSVCPDHLVCVVVLLESYPTWYHNKSSRGRTWIIHVLLKWLSYSAKNWNGAMAHLLWYGGSNIHCCCRRWRRQDDRRTTNWWWLSWLFGFSSYSADVPDLFVSADLAIITGNLLHGFHFLEIAADIWFFAHVLWAAYGCSKAYGCSYNFSLHFNAGISQYSGRRLCGHFDRCISLLIAMSIRRKKQKRDVCLFDR